MSADAATILSLTRQLRDIEMPAPPPLWPPAPGWWLLLLLASALSLLGLYWAWRRLRLRRTALRELVRLQRRFEVDGDAVQLAMGLSVLLRRVALARDAREQVAGLCGEDWLSYLDRRAGTRQFSAGPGRQLLTLPYRPQAQGADLAAMLELVRQWLRLNAR